MHELKIDKSAFIAVSPRIVGKVEIKRDVSVTIHVDKNSDGNCIMCMHGV